MSSRRPSSGRPSVTPRKTSLKQSEDFEYECKAAYLVVFDDLDDEIRSKEELNRVLQQAGRNPSRKTLMKYWRGKDLTFSDFCSICEKEPTTSEDELMKAFKKIDLNGDGYLSNSELRKVLTTKGEKMSEKDVAAIIEEVDENKDGKLDYREFCTFVMKTQEEAKQFAMENMKKKRPNHRSQKKEEDTQSVSSRTLQSNDNTEASEESDTTPTSDKDDSYSVKESARSRISVKEESKLLAGSPRLSARSKTSSSKFPLSARSLDKAEEAEDSKEMLARMNEKIREEDEDDDSEVSEDEEDIAGSRSSIKHGSNRSAYPPKPQPRRRSTLMDSGVREVTKSAITSKDHKLQKPRNIKEWHRKSSKGCFFFEDDGRIVSHQYTLDVPEDTNVWITVEPLRDSDGAPVDTMAFLLNESGGLVTFTEHRDNKGKYGVRCDLEAGVYRFIPFTTGCRFKRQSLDSGPEKKLVKKKGDGYQLTPAFKEALSEVFELCDLDGDGLMDRSEFNWFNVRTSGEEVNDEEWSIVEDNIDLQKGKLTKEGFIELNQMEADDNQGDTEDLWVTLSSMGFNKDLDLVEACPFNIEVYAEDTSVKLKVSGLRSGGTKLETAIVESTMGKGEATKVRQMKDLLLHTYSNAFRACVVVENKSSSKVRLELDCSKSRNIVSNRKSLAHKMDVPPKSVMVGFHLLPKLETREWSMVVNESIIS